MVVIAVVVGRMPPHVLGTFLLGALGRIAKVIASRASIFVAHFVRSNG